MSSTLHCLYNMKCAVNLSLSAGADYEKIEDYQHWWDPNNVVGKVGACVIIIIICSGTIGNLLVLTAICATAKLRKSYNVFIAALAVTDLIFNLVIMPFYVDTYIHRDWRFSEHLCRFNTFFGSMVIISSSLHLAFIAINRYVLIVHQDWYATCFSKRAIALQIAGIWLASFLIVLPGILGWHAMVQYSDQIGRCNYVRSASKGSLYLIFGIGFLLPCLIMLYCYMQISIVVYRSKQKLQNYRRTVKDRGEQESFLLNGGIRPRCRTMPEGKEAKRLKAKARNIAMLRLMTDSDLHIPSPFPSSEDIRSSRSYISENCAPSEDACGEDPGDNMSPTQEMNVRAESPLVSTGIPNGQPPQHSVIMEEEGTDDQEDQTADEQKPLQPIRQMPTIMVTDDQGSISTHSDSSILPTPPPRRMSQSLTCLDLQNKTLKSRMGSGLLHPKVKRNTVPMDGLRRQTTASPLSKNSSLSSSFLVRLRQRHHHKRHLKSFRMIIAVFLGFALTYLPFTLLNIADGYSCLNRAWYMFTSLFFWSGACINPWIYGIMNAQFRDAYQDIMCSCKRKSNPLFLKGSANSPAPSPKPSPANGTVK